MPRMITMNTYQIQVGFMAPQTASMLIPAQTQAEAERKALEHINRQFSNGAIIQSQLVSSEEVSEEGANLGESLPQDRVVVPFSSVNKQS